MSALYYCRQTTTACKGIPYPSKTHPYRYGTSGCVYTSGCGVCASLMALRNSTTRVFNTRQWTAVWVWVPGQRKARIWPWWPGI